MNVILRDFLQKFVIVYLNSVRVYNRTLNETEYLGYTI
jgi:hypothetical protein